MIYSKLNFIAFLTLVANVESFTLPTRTTTNTKTNLIHTTASSLQQQQYVAKQSSSYFGLQSLAATNEEETVESSTTEGESESEQQQPAVEADISQIAYVVNLSYDTPSFKLRELFNEHGQVQKIFMPKEKFTGRAKGMAFVTMSTEEERDLVIEKLNGLEVDGRVIYVDKAKPKTERSEEKESPLMKLYIGNISYETTKEDLEEFFEPYGGVEDIYIPLDRETGAPRGFAFASVERTNAENVMDNLNGVELRNRVIEVKESLPRGQKAPPRQYKRPSNQTKIYIGNLSFDTQEDTIRALFEEFGELIDVYIPIDRFSGRPRGFAFVTMDNSAASSAIEANDGVEVDGRILRVNEAQPKGYNPPASNDWDDEGDWGEEE